MTLFVAIITCTIMTAVAFMAWLVIDLVSDLNEELSNWLETVDCYQAGRKVGLFINRFLVVVSSPFVWYERMIDCGHGYTMTYQVIPIGIRKRIVMSIENFVSRAVDSVVSDTIIDRAIERALERKVMTRLETMTEPMTSVVPLTQRKVAAPIAQAPVAAPIAQAPVETKPPVTKPVSLPNMPTSQARCDADGHVQSVYCSELGFDVAINGRFNARVSSRSGHLIQWTSGKGRQMIGVVAGTTVKVGSDALIVRPLKDDLSGPTSFCIPVGLEKIKGLQVTKPIAKPKTVTPPVMPAKKRQVKAATTPAPVTQAPVNASEVDANDPRLTMGELVVIVHADGSIESTKTGEVKRFNPKGNNGFSVVLRKHRSVQPTSRVFFASDLGL